jgi:hypothetical protein
MMALAALSCWLLAVLLYIRVILTAPMATLDTIRIESRNVVWANAATGLAAVSIALCIISLVQHLR